MTDNPVLEALKILLTTSVAANVLIYFLVIVPKLYKAGGRFPVGLLPWRYFHDLRAYRLVLAALGKSSNGYFLILFLTWFNVMLAIAFGLVYWSSLGEDPFRRTTW